MSSFKRDKEMGKSCDVQENGKWMRDQNERKVLLKQYLLGMGERLRYLGGSVMARTEKPDWCFLTMYKLVYFNVVKGSSAVWLGLHVVLGRYWLWIKYWSRPQYLLAHHIKMERANHTATSDLALISFTDCVHQIWTNSEERPRRRNLLYVFQKWINKSIGKWKWAGPFPEFHLKKIL